MFKNNHILRKVCDDFHDLCVESLPDSAKTIYQVGMAKGIINKFSLIDRNEKIIWNNNQEDIKEVYYNHLHNDKYNVYKNNMDDIITICNLESKGFL